MITHFKNGVYAQKIKWNLVDDLELLPGHRSGMQNLIAKASKQMCSSGKSWEWHFSRISQITIQKPEKRIIFNAVD